MDPSHLPSLAPDESAAFVWVIYLIPRMLLPAGIHKSKGVFHQLSTPDLASLASSERVGVTSKVTSPTGT